MRKKLLTACALIGVAPMVIAAQPSGQVKPGTERVNPAAERAGKKIPNSWICTVKDSTPGNTIAAEARHSAALGAGQVTHVYTGAVRGFALNVPDQAIARIKRGNPSIASCEQDQVMSIATKTRARVTSDFSVKAGGYTPAGDYEPWGVDRVGGGTGSNFRRAWVIDSGIANHPDLTIDRNRSRSFVSGTSSSSDGNGHGTHVAGTIAAKANGTGVVGVAPGATLVALRVFDASGSGSNSAVIAAVDHVYYNASAGDVVNMSLGGGTSTTLDNAVLRASNRGIYFTLAAGNESMNANYSSPGRVNGTYIWTVSAFDESGRFASFSNYANPPIDVSEPGVDIVSTYLNNSFAYLSGTSMAAPHLAGLILQRSVRNGGRVTGDPDGNPDIIGVK